MNMPPRDLNTPHLFTPPTSREVWETRAAHLKQQILFSAGLWPMLPRTPLNPRVTGRTELVDCVIENVAIETRPGFFLCGNLYRPKTGKGPFPAILKAHGHWETGRLHREEDVPRADPPPAKPAPGRADLVAIGVNLARQGFVVFSYDMVGYNDTTGVSHRFAGSLDAWLWNTNLLGLQLWNSIRALDYVERLPFVDKRRLGMTGASGGGSQTFLLAAIDDRIKVAVPVNMVSAHMQGGCLCENGPGLRVGTDNVELAAAFAPRPLLLVAATGDWTKDNPNVEWPAVKKVYDLYGAGEKTAVRQFNYGHNYNGESREAMYAWFRRWLKDDRAKTPDVAEKPFTVDTAGLRIWNASHPQPTTPPEAEWVSRFRAEADKQFTESIPKDKRQAKRFRETFGPALRLSLAVDMPDVIPTAASDRHAVVIVGMEADRAAVAEIRKTVMDTGLTAFPLFLPPIDITPDNLWKAFFTTYNRTPLGERVQAILDEMEKRMREGYGRINLIGVGAAGAWTLLARASAYDRLPGATVADMDGFDPNDDRAYIARLYAPGLRRAGGVVGAALLTASASPNPLCLYRLPATFPVATIRDGYRALHATPLLQTEPLSPSATAAWIRAAPLL